jgi:hypothetical protein
MVGATGTGKTKGVAAGRMSNDLEDFIVWTKSTGPLSVAVRITTPFFFGGLRIILQKNRILI